MKIDPAQEHQLGNSIQQNNEEKKNFAQEPLEHKMQLKLPMVEMFETVQGEGTKAGHLTTFVRVFNCNLRCTWCDTPYSYAPARPEYFATIGEICAQVEKFNQRYVCLTGGEPLMHGKKSLALVQALAQLDNVQDVHIETNGAIDLQPFVALRNEDPLVQKKVRFILDYKLPASGEEDRMIMSNYDLLAEDDEIKFVIGSEEDFAHSRHIVEQRVKQGQVLFSPVWETMKPERLVQLMLEHGLSDVKLSLQLHKVIWHPDKRGV